MQGVTRSITQDVGALTKPGNRFPMRVMLNHRIDSAPRQAGQRPRRGRCALPPATLPLAILPVAILLLATLLLTGCLSPLAKHTADLSRATNAVIDRSKDTYQLAGKLHDDVVVSDAVTAFDTDPAWDPHKPLKVLLTPEQLAARIAVLDALKIYVESLDTLASGRHSDELKQAAASTGNSLSSLAANAATVFGQGNAAAAILTPDASKGISAAVLALGGYLGTQRVKSEAPRTIVAMDPTITALCRFFGTDATVLARQAKNDFEQELEHENSFIRKNAARLSPVEHRNEIASMLMMVRRERTTEELFLKLNIAIERLALAHAALATAAEKKDTASFHERLAELVHAGTTLGAGTSLAQTYTSPSP